MDELNLKRAWVLSVTALEFRDSVIIDNRMLKIITSVFIAELWRAKRACGAPWVSKSTHPRKFGVVTRMDTPKSGIRSETGTE